MHRSAPKEMAGFLHFSARKQALLEVRGCNLCTVPYFGHIDDRFKAVFDAAESLDPGSPSPRGELDVLSLLVGDSDAV